MEHILGNKSRIIDRIVVGYHFSIGRCGDYLLHSPN